MLDLGPFNSIGHSDSDEVARAVDRALRLAQRVHDRARAFGDPWDRGTDSVGPRSKSPHRDTRRDRSVDLWKVGGLRV